ncbi:hypothetical protein SAMN05216184_11940 [Georgenia satyanarayanai]|uniref:Uncharacterized protein n=1 Tax=Georgenia satyanarayanai TaxID=860221 RepID=A0A2Y9AXX0_9MICO|nr:hypothetical protein [Georgenia satyanarayanai]PYF96380.1 hypothetical protein A8987_11940 [Georgenia satyanarayanai]SSA46929.1 hypothetical protein SAMN05216184_11940 [Georgenia satyanarayanai]
MAVPAGHTIPRRVSDWVEQALAHPGTATMTPRSWRTYRAVVLATANAIDPKSKTTVFSWTSLAAAVLEVDPTAASSRATIARYLRRLRDWKLLGVVASGRTAQYAPAAGGGSNERAVYVLSVLRPLQPVDSFETPPLKEAGVLPRTHARGDLAQTTPEPLRGPTPSAAQARPAPLPAQRQLPAWPRSVTPKRKDDMLAAAGTLRHLIPVLRRISPEHVRSIARPYFLAGWTVADLHHAIDHLPGGRRWPHDGADGVGNVGAWLSYRLAVWRDAHGTVRRSNSQRILAEQRHNAALARARREAEAATRAAAAGPMSPGRQLARAVAEAIRSGKPVPTLPEQSRRQAPSPAPRPLDAPITPS